MMAGRKSKLSRVQKHLLAAIKTGATDVDACASVGIGQTTFYEWLAIGNAVISNVDHQRMPVDEVGRQHFAEFAEALTRARIAAKVTAIGTLHSAMMPTQTVRRTKHTVTETRQNQWGKEFLYVKTDEDELTVLSPGDWRAAVEYLKRRHGTEWGDKQTNVNYNVDPALMENLFKTLEAAGINASDVFNEIIATAAEQGQGVGADSVGESSDESA